MFEHAQSVLKRRALVLMIVRLLALLVCAAGLYHVVYALFVALYSGDLQNLGALWDDGFNRMGMGVGLLVSGTAAALASGPLVRWIVPAAPIECPSCGYELRALTEPVCPECGYLLSHLPTEDQATPQMTAAEGTSTEPPVNADEHV